MSNQNSTKLFDNELVEVLVDIEDSFIFEAKPNQKLVSNGKLADLEIDKNFNLNYAFVPLGLILEGSIIVNKNGKDSKALTKGDYIGLFETADYLINSTFRQIGDWNLTTETDTKILFFTQDFWQQKNQATCNFKELIINKAKNNSVPLPLTSLPLLDYIAFHTTQSRLDDYAIIAHTHLLPNQVPLFRHLASLVGTNRIFVISKPYSTVNSAYIELTNSGIEVIPIKLKAGFPYSFCAKDPIEAMWYKLLESRKHNSFNKLLILDDGGDLWTTIPWHKIGDLQITGTEQTQRGITRIIDSKMQLPAIVSVATSGVKKIIESVFIAKSVVDEIKKQVDLANKNIGIIGMGSIGHSIYQDLKQKYSNIFYYDINSTNYGDGYMSNLSYLVQKCDIIIGATGVDTLHDLPFERIIGNKILISASSADVEFESILRFLPDRDDDIFGVQNIQVHEHLNFKILNGGYPINFNRTHNATPDNEIVLTRCLLYIGMMQAVEIIKNQNHKVGFYNLDTIAQTKLLHKWFTDFPVESKDFELDQELDNIDKGKIPEFITMDGTVWKE